MMMPLQKKKLQGYDSMDMYDLFLRFRGFQHYKTYDWFEFLKFDHWTACNFHDCFTLDPDKIGIFRGVGCDCNLDPGSYFWGLLDIYFGVPIFSVCSMRFAWRNYD